MRVVVQSSFLDDDFEIRLSLAVGAPENSRDFKGMFVKGWTLLFFVGAFVVIVVMCFITFGQQGSRKPHIT